MVFLDISIDVLNSILDLSFVLSVPFEQLLKLLNVFLDAVDALSEDFFLDEKRFFVALAFPDLLGELICQQLLIFVHVVLSLHEYCLFFHVLFLLVSLSPFFAHLDRGVRVHLFHFRGYLWDWWLGLWLTVFFTLILIFALLAPFLKSDIAHLVIASFLIINK